MSTYSQERNGNSMGDPTDQGRHPVSGRGSTAGKNTGNGAKSASFKSGVILKGIPAHNTGEFPKFPGYASGGKELTQGQIKKGTM